MPFAPTSLFYLISLRCNERCSKCSHWRVQTHLPMIDPLLVVDAVRGIPSAEEFCIVGGEPLLHRERVIKILDGIADLDVRTTIVTNGVLCTPRFVDRLRGKNVHLVFSIDTIRPDRWLWVRGTTSMNKVLNNLEYVRRVLEPEQFSVQSVLSEETRDDVAEVGQWCAERRIYQSVQPYIQEGFDGEWTPIDYSATNRHICSLSHDSSEASELPCLAAGRNLSILPDGTVITCFQQEQIPGAKKPLGLLGHSSIEHIITSKYAEEVIERMRRCNLPCKVLKCNQ